MSNSESAVGAAFHSHVFLGEAYIIQGKYDLAKDQLTTIEKLCGKECEYYQDLSEALEQAHAL